MLKFFALALYYSVVWRLPRWGGAGPNGLGRLRGRLGRLFFECCGRGVAIDARARVGSGSGIRIGDRSVLGYGCSLTGPVTIGSDCILDAGAICQPQNHRFDRLDVPMREQGHLPSAEIVIEDDVWVGTRAIILPGVTVGRGAVITPGAVVTRDVPAYAIAAGNPARITGTRGAA